MGKKEESIFESQIGAFPLFSQNPQNLLFLSFGFDDVVSMAKVYLSLGSLKSEIQDTQVRTKHHQ